MLTALCLGLVVGLILALTGAGGGILAVPLLVFGTGATVAQAGPVGLMAVGMAAALGAALGLRAGSMSYVWRGNVFTGDTLLIDGCGRTDFQSGSSDALFDSVTGKLFTLPADTRMWPGHDYKGQSVSTIGWEKAHNARLANRSREDFCKLMSELDLPKPKLIDVAVPANQSLGLPFLQTCAKLVVIA